MSSGKAAARYKRGLSDGSLAYDISSAENYREYVYGTPLDIPEAPVLQEELVSAKSAAVSAQAISPVAVIGYAIAAALLIFSLLARVQLSALSNENVVLQTSLTELHVQEAKLLIQYESILNLPEVEHYAINTLGMQKPRSDQISYVSGSVQDRAVVLAAATEDTGLADRIGDFLSSVLEYFG